MKNSTVQYYVATIALNVLKIIQVQHNRANSVYQDTILKAIPICLKVINDIPIAGQYAYESNVTVQFCQILKLGARPRIEEQFDIIKKIEARLVSELKNLESKSSTV